MVAHQSDFLHWAKTRPKPKYDLALSGILNLPVAELDVNWNDLELHGDNAYGDPELVNALAAHCRVPPEMVVTISGGASMANHLAMAALLEHGDEVLIEQPTYEPILAVAQFLGAAIKRFRRRFEHQYRVETDELSKEITPRTRLIILTTLHNPSSALTDERALRRIGDLARDVGARVLVDEVYLETGFEIRPSSSVKIGPEFIATSSLTKGYGLSGLRCGWILAEPELAERIRRLNNIFGAVGPHPAERLSLVALRQLPKIALRAEQILKANRAALNEFFDGRTDLEVVRTNSGTTSFPRCQTRDTDALTRLLIDKYETAVVPGRFFESPQHIRIGICCEPENFRIGLERLGRALDQEATRL
jgi:aspartate/methionine/tyrosine aminotransferase